MGFGGVHACRLALFIAVYSQLVLITPCAEYSAYSEAVQTNNELGTQIYELLSKEDDGNVLFSPLGMTLALGAVRLGARGRIATQIDRVAHWTPRTIHRELKTLRSQITAGRTDDVHLEVKNHVFGYRVLGLRYKYRKIIRYYGTRTKIMTSAEILDYFTKRGRTDFGKKAVPQTMFVNNVRLDAHWEIPFSVFTKSSFYIPRQAGIPAKVIQASYMGFMPDEHQFNYFNDQENKCQFIELNYGKADRLGDMWDPFYNPADISMVIALPYKGIALQKLEEKLSMDKVKYWLSRMRQTNIDVSIPKFNLSRFINAAKLFQKLGIQDFHSKSADQSNPWMFRSVWQGASLAASGPGTNSEDSPVVLSIVLLSKPKQIFHADHPFVFLVRDKASDTILYIGRVVNPNVGN